MSEAAEDFEALLARARQGDRAAEEQLVREYEPHVRRVVRFQLGPALRPYLDTLDVVNSVHKSLLIGLRQKKFEFASLEDLLALALTMARRKVARHWRRAQRQRRLDSAETGSGDLPLVLASLSCPHADPARAAEFRDTVEHVCRQLNEVERPILELAMQGHNNQEIADSLNRDVNVIRVYRSRLRQRLRDQGVLSDWL